MHELAEVRANNPESLLIRSAFQLTRILSWGLVTDAWPSHSLLLEAKASFECFFERLVTPRSHTDEHENDPQYEWPPENIPEPRCGNTARSITTATGRSSKKAGRCFA